VQRGASPTRHGRPCAAHLLNIGGRNLGASSWILRAVHYHNHAEAACVTIGDEQAGKRGTHIEKMNDNYGSRNGIGRRFKSAIR
jgi:hypothetical protein